MRARACTWGFHMQWPAQRLLPSVQQLFSLGSSRTCSAMYGNLSHHTPTVKIESHTFFVPSDILFLRGLLTISFVRTAVMIFRRTPMSRILLVVLMNFVICFAEIYELNKDSLDTVSLFFFPSSISFVLPLLSLLSPIFNVLM